MLVKKRIKLSIIARQPKNIYERIKEKKTTKYLG